MTSVDQRPTVFVVDWSMAWPSIDEALSAQQALDEARRRVGLRGTQVECLHSLFVPAEQRWICVLTADEPAALLLTTGMAQIPERYIRTGLDLRTPSAGAGSTL